MGFLHRYQIICKAISLDQIWDFQPANIEPAFSKNLKSSSGIDRYIKNCRLDIPWRLYPFHAWKVEYTDEFEAWWFGLDEEEQIDIAAVVGLLEEKGPHLPYTNIVCQAGCGIKA